MIITVSWGGGFELKGSFAVMVPWYICYGPYKKPGSINAARAVLILTGGAGSNNAARSVLILTGESVSINTDRGSINQY